MQENYVFKRKEVKKTSESPGNKSKLNMGVSLRKESLAESEFGQNVVR